MGRPDTFTILSALAAVTDRLGLAGTINSTFNEPYEVARQFATLDHRLASFYADTTEIEVSVKDRAAKGQKVTLVCWIAGRQKVVTTSSEENLHDALNDIRADPSRGLAGRLASPHRAASATVRVSGPAWSSDQDRTATPALLTRPYVGFIPAIPFAAAGARIEPPVSLPVAAKQRPAAIAAPDPPLEPDGI